MIKVGDSVKVIGTTVAGLDENKECIKIGTICRVVGTEIDEKAGLIVGIIPEGRLPYYAACREHRRLRSAEQDLLQ